MVEMLVETAVLISGFSANFIARKGADLIYEKIKDRHFGEKRSFRRAIASAATKFSDKYPELNASFFDEYFINNIAISQLELLLTGQVPNSNLMASAYQNLFGETTISIVKATDAADDLIMFVVDGMKKERLHDWVHQYDHNSMKRSLDSIKESFNAFAEAKIKPKPVYVVNVSEDTWLAGWLVLQIMLINYESEARTIPDTLPELNFEKYMNNLCEQADKVILVLSNRLAEKFFRKLETVKVYVAWFNEDIGPQNIIPLTYESLGYDLKYPIRGLDITSELSREDGNAILRMLATYLCKVPPIGHDDPPPVPEGLLDPKYRLEKQKHERSSGGSL